jgi:hypothetical protein
VAVPLIDEEIPIPPIPPTFVEESKPTAPAPPPPPPPVVTAEAPPLKP